MKPQLQYSRMDHSLFNSMKYKCGNVQDDDQKQESDVCVVWRREWCKSSVSILRTQGTGQKRLRDTYTEKLSS